MSIQFFNNYPFKKEFILLELSVREDAYSQPKAIVYTFCLLGFGVVIVAIKK